MCLHAAIIVSKAELTVVENHEINLFAPLVNDFLWMSELFLKVFGKFKQGLFWKISEKYHSVPNVFVHFFEEFLLERTWKLWNKLVLLFNVGISLDDCWFFDVICEFILNFRVNWCFLRDLIKNFEVAVFFEVISADFRYDLTNPVDIVGQNNTAHGLNKNHAKSLILVGRDNITKAYSQHNGRGPVITPYILLIPQWLIQTFGNQPIFLFVESSHGD